MSFHKRILHNENTYHLSTLNNTVSENLTAIKVNSDVLTSNIATIDSTLSGNLSVNVLSSVLPDGGATEAKQDDIINLLEGQTPALNRTHAIPVQIMVGDAGGNYDALRANGQDLLVKVDDMDPDCAVNSGLATSAKQDTTHFLIGLLATKAEQATQSTTLTNIDNSTSNIDGKILKSAVVASDGTTSAQTVQVCGSNDGVNLRTMSVYDTGELRTVIHGEDNTSNIHPLVVSNTGTLITEIEHSWDTEILENATPLAGGGTALTTGALDLGQGISHEYNDIVFFVTNSANMSIDLQPQSSPDGVNWFVSAAGVSVTTTQNKSYMCSKECFNFGDSRFMRLRIVNNGVSSTNITVETGRYK